MGVLREYRCFAHDLEFESTEANPRCPAGCSRKFVVQEFRTAPSIRSGGTRVADVMQRQLAQDYGLTDMRNDKDGSSVMSSTRSASGGARQSAAEAPRAYWNPSLFPVRQGWAARGEQAPVFNPKSAGLSDGGVPIRAIQDGARNHLRRATSWAKPEKLTRKV